METTERAKSTRVRADSKRPGAGPGPNLGGKKIILTSETIARKRAKMAMRAFVVMILRRSAAIR